jgi:YHS domain-containing protein
MNKHILRRFNMQLPSAFIAAGLLVGLTGTIAQAGEINTGYFDNVAIEGYDTVAYFTDGKATKGSEQFSHDWLGTSWHFASDEHRKLFTANPIAYAPQFGGLCAEGVAFHETTVNIEPEVWQIIDGKLYMTAGVQFPEAFEEEIRPQAEKIWPEVRAVLTQ